MVWAAGPSVGEKVKIMTLDGNTLLGDVRSVNDAEILLSTGLGDLMVDREKIRSLEIISSKNEIGSKTYFQKNLVPQKDLPLNQEARWRTIYSAMLLGNGLYGLGVPYVLGIEPSRSDLFAFQLLTFAGGFFGGYHYTREMELPYGRWQFQNTGGALGALSVIPLVVTFGESWSNIDPEGKVALAYVMCMTPYGILKADQLYNKWNLTNGQASLISQSSGWGFFNALGAMALVYGDNPPSSVASIKLNTLAVYGAGLAAPILSKKYFTKTSYTEDDASFIASGFALGYVNAMRSTHMLDIQNVRANVLLFMGIMNGFGYLADKLVENVDLGRGSAKIIGLGTGAALLIRWSIAILLEEEYNNLSTALDLAALNAGWYYTFKRVSKDKGSLSLLNKKEKKISFSLAPAVIELFNKPLPAMSVKLTFY